MKAVALGRRQRLGDIIQRQTRKSQIDTPGHEGGSRLGALGHRAKSAPQRIVHRVLQAEALLSPQCFKLDADVRVQGQGGSHASCCSSIWCRDAKPRAIIPISQGLVKRPPKAAWGLTPLAPAQAQSDGGRTACLATTSS